MKVFKLPMAELPNGTFISKYTKLQTGFNSLLFVEGVLDDGTTVLLQRESNDSIKLKPICSGVREVSVWNVFDIIECLDDDKEEICLVNRTDSKYYPYEKAEEQPNCEKTGLPKPNKTKAML